MKLEIMTEDVKVIQGLSDYPNQEEGLTAGEMKAKFDEAAVRLQNYLNEKVVPAVNDKLSASELNGAVENATNNALAGITPDKIGAAPAVESLDHPGCYYRTVNGVTEWLNPPMAVGTVYRTTERFGGKAVYARAINIGSLPNTATKQARYVPTDGRSATNIVNLRGFAMNESGRPQPLPLNYNGQVIELHANAESVFVRTITDNTQWTAVVAVKYTID